MARPKIADAADGMFGRNKPARRGPAAKGKAASGPVQIPGQANPASGLQISAAKKGPGSRGAGPAKAGFRAVLQAKNKVGLKPGPLAGIRGNAPAKPQAKPVKKGSFNAKAPRKNARVAARRKPFAGR